ncbi:MAG: hypothetical protein WDN66_02765 [Candidatus Saccharibacteria bacterium]
MPMFLERADKPERGGAFVAYRATNEAKIKELANKYLDDSYPAGEPDAVTLTGLLSKK